MIVDDEEPVLESFCYIMKKGVPGFELCGVARSGAEAVALVPELRPDLVFMDIQMQGMDGLEAIARIQQTHPDIIFILSTAYERFDIAQRAIPLGLFNYLVKPVSRKALEEEFAKVKAQLDDMREKSDQRSREARFAQLMREEEMKRFLLGLAWKSPGEEEWREFARLFAVKGDTAAVMLVKAEASTPPARTEAAYQGLCRRLQYKLTCLSAVLAGQAIMLIPEPAEPERLPEIVEAALPGTEGPELRYGLGAFRHYSALSESYREAFEQLRSLEGGRDSAVARRRQERELRDKLIYGEWDEAMARYERHWTDVFVANDFQTAKARMIAFFAGLFDSLDAEKSVQCEIDVDPAEEISALSSLAAWRQWSDYMMDRLRYIIKENRDQYFPRPLGLAVNYLRANYAKPIQLAQVAEHCRISQGYLSRLFSEYLNTTFIDYLNELRVGEAARLLRAGGKSVKEVAYMVGYGDPNYFSRVFRRYMKVSPSELTKGGVNGEE
jgi:two-component system response regulator YesN